MGLLLPSYHWPARSGNRLLSQERCVPAAVIYLILVITDYNLKMPLFDNISANMQTQAYSVNYCIGFPLSYYAVFENDGMPMISTKCIGVVENLGEDNPVNERLVRS